jgi:hypothetical protein
MSYEILCQDSKCWLQSKPDQSINNIITGLPDMNELGDDYNKDKYIQFFDEISSLIFNKIKPQGYAIFIQTDRKNNGELIDKSYHLTKSAYKCGMKLLWHKIVCNRDAGKIDIFRPSYSHFLCYTKSGSVGKAFQDVYPKGTKIYNNATPQNVSESAADFVSNKLKQKVVVGYDVVDPFVGRGTIGIDCVKKGLSFLGIDIDKSQCEYAENILKKTICQEI